MSRQAGTSPLCRVRSRYERNGVGGGPRGLSASCAPLARLVASRPDARLLRAPWMVLRPLVAVLHLLRLLRLLEARHLRRHRRAAAGDVRGVGGGGTHYLPPSPQACDARGTGSP